MDEQLHKRRLRKAIAGTKAGSSIGLFLYPCAWLNSEIMQMPQRCRYGQMIEAIQPRALLQSDMYAPSRANVAACLMVLTCVNNAQKTEPDTVCWMCSSRRRY